MAYYKNIWEIKVVEWLSWRKYPFFRMGSSFNSIDYRTPEISRCIWVDFIYKDEKDLEEKIIKYAQKNRLNVQSIEELLNEDEIHFKIYYWEKGKISEFWEDLLKIAIKKEDFVKYDSMPMCYNDKEKEEVKKILLREIDKMDDISLNKIKFFHLWLREFPSYY